MNERLDQTRLEGAILRHRRISDERVRAVRAAMQQSIAVAQAAFTRFRRAVEEHMRIEERDMFPALEQHLDATKGPTASLRKEHERFRHTFAYIAACIEADDRPGAAFALERLTEQLDAHDMREEWVLLPMCERLLDPAKLAALAGALEAAAS
jgi:iron-sulfur cluster repair protein YtfE (RIC family)